MLSDVEAGDETTRVLASKRLRVMAASHPFVRGIVRVVRLDREASVATVRLDVDGSEREESVPLNKLEVLDELSGSASAAAIGTEANAAGVIFKTGDYVRVRSGKYAASFRAAYFVVAWHGDGKYQVLLTMHGVVVLDGADLVRTTPDYAQRPSKPLPLPAPRQGMTWSTDQVEALRYITHERCNLLLGGEPGKGKTEVMGQSCYAFQEAGEAFLVVSLSNAIVTFLCKRLTAHGITRVSSVCGTYSRKLWASLGADFRHDRVHVIVQYILSNRHTQEVVKAMRETQILFVEEDENTLPHFKDVLFRVISGVCGHVGHLQPPPQLPLGTRCTR